MMNARLYAVITDLLWALWICFLVPGGYIWGKIMGKQYRFASSFVPITVLSTLIYVGLVMAILTALNQIK